MTAIIITLLFFAFVFIVIGIGISSKPNKHEKSRQDNSTFVLPYINGDSHLKNGQDTHPSNDSFGSDGGGGGGGE